MADWIDVDEPPDVKVGRGELLLEDGRIVGARLDWDSIGPDFFNITEAVHEDGSTMSFFDAKGWRPIRK
jgi:hypothetical protein